jgi:light-regulated signal transduction histidine kinase (bacteriophytochrome)
VPRLASAWASSSPAPIGTRSCSTRPTRLNASRSLISRVGRVEQERVPIGAGELLAQAEANLGTAIRRARAEIEARDLPVVLAEPALLTAVFQNLISNAIKFRGERSPRVQVSAARDGDFWVFAVADNGIGISSEYAERIFVIFQRLHDKATYPGTGIGLAMTKKIIEYHGGRIWLDTTATTGARFSFTLPVVPDDPVPEPVAPAGPAARDEPVIDDPVDSTGVPATFPAISGAPRRDDDSDER